MNRNEREQKHEQQLSGKKRKAEYMNEQLGRTKTYYHIGIHTPIHKTDIRDILFFKKFFHIKYITSSICHTIEKELYLNALLDFLRSFISFLIITQFDYRALC